MKVCCSLILLYALTAPATATLCQTPATAQDQQEEVVRVGSSEVLLDAVVKDKKGRPVKDLAASDFEIYEDGVRQRIQSFRLVARAGGTAPAAPKGAGPRVKENGPAAVASAGGRAAADPLAGVGAVALVFDRLSPEARARARQAALSYIAEGLQPSDFVGVFSIDLSLRTLQPFTNNAQLVRAAIEGAASHSPSSYASSAPQVREMENRQASLESGIATAESSLSNLGASRGGGAGGGSSLGADVAQQAFEQMQIRMAQTFEALERNQQGYATTNGLLSIVNALGALPGRKSLVLFSEGLALPTDVQSQFRSVISNANRANVAIYSVDAAGLRVESPNAETQREITQLGARRMRQNASGREDTSGQPMTRMLERNEDLLRLNPHSGLGQLAEETGGRLISETNDPGAALRQVNDDLHTYYALTYVPTNRNFDGSFRQISLKVDRPDLEVQTRKGYYAINNSDSSPVLAYEAPALALLGGSGRAGEFPVRVAAFNFSEPKRPTLVPVLVEAPAGAFAYSADAEKKTYTTDFTILALIKDESQRVVRKLSRHYLLSGPLGEAEAARRGETLFYRETDLPPGRYTVAAVAYDALTGRAGVGTAGLEVKGAEEGKLRLSSVAVISRAEKLPAGDQQTANPFRFGDVLLYPDLGGALRKSAGGQMVFFLTAYTAPGAKGAPKLNVEIEQEGRVLGRAALDLPRPDAEGRIQYAGTLPIDKLQPGSYRLKVTVTDGQSSATRTEDFAIRP